MHREFQFFSRPAELARKSQSLVVVCFGIMAGAQTLSRACESARGRAALVELCVGAEATTLGPRHRPANRLTVAQCVLGRQGGRRHLAAYPFGEGTVAVGHLPRGRVRRLHRRCQASLAVVLAETCTRRGGQCLGAVAAAHAGHRSSTAAKTTLE